MGFLSKTKALDTATVGQMSQASSSNAGQPDMDGTVSDTETESTCPGEQPSHNETVSDLKTCDAECCCMTRDKPNQPTSKHVLARTKRIQGSQARYVQANWYKDHTWLTLCTTRQKLFCFPCMTAESRNLMVFSKNTEASFVSAGFCNWRKASQCFRKHETSQAHSEALLKLSTSHTDSIASQLDNARKKEDRLHREALIKQLSSLRYLTSQGLPIRGHDDTEGNLFQLMQLRSEDDPNLKAWVCARKYFSPEIVNEQMEIMANCVLRNILSDIHSADWFAIIADEATDVSKCEQLCICIRWVDNSYELSEDPIGLVKVPKTDSETLYSTLRDVCVRCMLPFEKLRGQAYDGASNMSGHIRGVAARVKREQKAALYVHYLAHSLNLCLQDAARVCTPIRDCLHLVMGLVQLIKWSPKRSTLFEKLKHEMTPGTHDLRPLCPTRWTVRTGAINGVLANYSTLCRTLDEISASGRDEYAMKASGYLQQMEKFSTFFGLKLGYLVFSVTERLSCILQGKDTTIQEAVEAAKLTESYLRRLRSDEEYTKFYRKVLETSKDLTDEPVLPRKRKIPRRINDGADPHQHETTEDLHRQHYFQALDEVVNELTRRFDQRDIKVVAEIEKLLLSAARGDQEIVVPDAVQETYRSDISMEPLIMQLKLIPNLIQRHKHLTGVTIKKVTNIRTLCDIMNSNPAGKSMCPELHALLKLYMTIPVTTSTAERTFSTMRRIKTYLRSTMTQERLNHSFMLNAHKPRVAELDLKHIAKLFISANDRRCAYFGKM